MSVLTLQHLIGKQVLGQNGKPIGRIEEVVAEKVGGELFVTEYHIGTFALLERLSAGEIGRSLLRFLRAGRGDGLAVPWDKLDLTSPNKPKLLCSIDALQPPVRQMPQSEP